MTTKEVENLAALLGEIKDDNSVPKNIRLRIERTLKILGEETEMHIKVSKVLNELEEIVEDANLQPYTRTQIWDVISSLEKSSN